MEPEHFWSRVDIGEPDDCWEWQGGKSEGYGKFKRQPAHRVAWELLHGRPVPEGLYVCHHCDNKGCCNPYHLFLGTNQDNQVDAARKGRLTQAKLTREDVRVIRELYATGNYYLWELAEEYGVDKAHVGKIILEKSWAWLT